jgi:hypothetical protein
MDIQEAWEKALKNTEIIRSRVKALLTFATTDLPYILLSASSVNLGDTVVRKGKVLVEKPSLILPSNLPQFEGFDFEKELHFNEDTITNFFLVRGVKFPSLKYNNQTYSLDIYEGRLDKAIKHFSDQLQRKEDVHSGLIVGPEDCWQFSLLIFVCSMVVKSADGDIKNILEDLRRKGKLS